MVVQGLFQFAHHGVSEPALAEAHDGFAMMGLGPQKGDLGTTEHGTARANDVNGSLARGVEATLAAIKRELAAVLVVGLIGAPLVMLGLEGAREALVLAGYGLGAILWVHVRVRGLRLALRRARRDPTSGQAASGNAAGDDGA